MPLVLANSVFFDLFEFLGVRVARRFEPPTVAFEEPSSPVMAAHGASNTIHVELPSINPFASEEPPRRGAADRYRRAQSDDEATVSDDNGIVSLPNLNPYAAPEPRNRRGGRGQHRPARAPSDDEGSDRGITVLSSDNPFAPEPKPSQRRPEPRSGSPPRRVRPTWVDHDRDERSSMTVLQSDDPFAPNPNRPSSQRSPESDDEIEFDVDTPVESEEEDLIVKPIPVSPPRRRGSSFSEEEERVVISSGVADKDANDPTSDEEKPVTQLSVEDPFGPPVMRNRPSNPALNKGHQTGQGYSLIDDRGVIYVELPSVNPFDVESEKRRSRLQRLPSIEDFPHRDAHVPSNNPFGPRRVEADPSSEDEGAGVTVLSSENPFSR